MTAPLDVREVLPNVWRLQVPLAYMDPNEVSLWLLRGSDGDVLVDAAMPGSEDAVDEALGRAGSDRSQILKVVVTHEHVDHLGSAGSFGVPVAIHPLTHRLLQMFLRSDPSRWERLRDRYWLSADDLPDPALFERFRAMLELPEVVEELDDGDCVAGTWRVIWTPGHGTGHICLYNEAARALIAGDHVLPGYTPHIGMDPFHDDPVGAYIESLLRVTTLDVGLVLPSHGEPFTDLRSAVDALLAHHAQRLERIEEVVREPKTVREVTEWVFRAYESPMDTAMATIEAGAHLVHLEQIGRVSRTDGRRWVAEHRTRTLGPATARR